MGSAPQRPSSNPYPGLRPFEEQEEHLFFGREQQTDQMVDTLAAQRLLAVVGGSGSGKSSLVICGLQPALHRGLMAAAGSHWRVARFRPGLRPIAALAAALATAISDDNAVTTPELPLVDVVDTNLRLSRLGLVDVYGQMLDQDKLNLLVVVDQFEELFRYRMLRESGPMAIETEAMGEARALINLLLAATAQRQSPIFVVLTMRSDFLGDCAQFQSLPEAISKGLYLVPRLSREERRQAIANPALISGTKVDPVLLTQLVNDVGDDPDQLSILQHALNRTWSHWHGRGGQGPITMADYQAIGTMATALDSHAEQALADFPGPEGVSLSGRLFRALTDKASDPRGIRRPTTLGELRAICAGKPSTVDQLIDHFRRSDRAFLMPPAGEPLREDSVIDISHESLMRVWRRLDRWANAEAESARLFLRLADAARRHGLGQASLWRDPELELALQWREQEQPNPAWARRYDPDLEGSLAFLQQSRDVREQDRHRRQVQRRRTMAGLAGLSVMASLVASFCWWQWQQTRLSRARAFAATAAAYLDTARPHASLLYGLAAMERLIHDPAEALAVADTLAQAASLNWQLASLATNQKTITVLLQQRNGDWVTAGADGSLQRWRQDRPLGDPILTGQGKIHRLLELADGVVVSGGDDGTLRRWRDGQPIGPPLTASQGAVYSLVQLSDGELVSGDSNGELRRWRDFRPIGTPIATGQGRLTALLALPGGDLLSGGSAGEGETASRDLRRWRRGTSVGAAIRTGHDGVLQLVGRGDQVFSLGSEGLIQTWRPGQGATTPWQTKAKTPPSPRVRQLALLAGGDLVTSHEDGSLRRWQGDREAGLGYAASAELSQLVGLADGRILAADAGNRLSLLKPAAQIAALVDSGQSGVWSLVLQRDGVLITGGEDGSLRRWRQERPLGPPLPTGQGSVRVLTTLPNGDLLSGGSLITKDGEQWGGSLRRWRGTSPLSGPLPLAMGPLRGLLTVGDDEVLSIADDGDKASALQHWRLRAGEAKALGGPGALPAPPISSLVRQRNDELISASRIDGELRRWQHDGGTRLRQLAVLPTALEGIGSLALLQDDRYLAIGSTDSRPNQEVVIFDLRTRQIVGRPLPLGEENGWATALAVLPNQGLLIATSGGKLRWIQPQRILAAACAQLHSDDDQSSNPTPNGMGPLVKPLAQKACQR
jgi:WD40 repeat protein